MKLDESRKSWKICAKISDIGLRVIRIIFFSFMPIYAYLNVAVMAWIFGSYLVFSLSTNISWEIALMLPIALIGFLGMLLLLFYMPILYYNQFNEYKKAVLRWRYD